MTSIYKQDKGPNFMNLYSLSTGAFFFLFISQAWVISSQLPATDLYLFDLSHSDRQWSLTNPRLASQNVKICYQNQPYFTSSQSLMISSDEGIPGKTDLWLLDLSTSHRTRLTHSSRPKYSPQLRPKSEKLTYIGVEPDSAQFLFEKIPGSSNEHRLLPSHPHAGYYSWFNSHILALFKVGDPHRLVLIDLRDQKEVLVGLHPGRSFQFHADGTLIYVQKTTDEAWYLKRYNPAMHQSDIIVKTPSGSEDFCMLPDGSFLMTHQSTLLRYHPKESITWQPIADLSVYHLHHLTRIAHWEGKILAVVNTRP